MDIIKEISDLIEAKNGNGNIRSVSLDYSNHCNLTAVTKCGVIISYCGILGDFFSPCGKHFRYGKFEDFINAVKGA